MLEQVVRLHIALDGIRPEIWRRIEVPLNSNLDGLHRIIQASMGWLNYHCYEFSIGDKVYGTPNSDWAHRSSVRSARSTRLSVIIAENTKMFGYLYDFGDRWRHTVTIETVEIADANLGFPRLIGGMRRCPPEDVGGVDGYCEFIQALADSNHYEHTSWVEWYNSFEWYDQPFDPDNINARALRLRLGDIARRHIAAKRAHQTRKSAIERSEI